MSQEPRFYGSVTVGERGQVVVPAGARKRLGIEAGDKLLVFGIPGGVGFFKAESVTRVLSRLMGRLSSLEKALADPSAQGAGEALEEGPDKSDAKAHAGTGLPGAEKS